MGCNSPTRTRENQCATPTRCSLPLNAKLVPRCLLALCALLSSRRGHTNLPAAPSHQSWEFQNHIQSRNQGSLRPPRRRAMGQPRTWFARSNGQVAAAALRRGCSPVARRNDAYTRGAVYTRCVHISPARCARAKSGCLAAMRTRQSIRSGCWEALRLRCSGPRDNR